MSNQTIKPQARQEEIVVQEVGEEVLLYDKRRRQLHTLNPTAAWVWQQLDGQTDTGELARRLGERFPELAGHADHVLWAALKRLEEKQLLAATQPRLRPQIPAGLETRRSMLKRLGLGLALLPVIVTLVAPPPAMAVSGCPSGACFSSQQEAIDGGCATDRSGQCYTTNTTCTSSPPFDPSSATLSDCFAGGGQSWSPS